MNALYEKINRLRAENERLQTEANKNMVELCRLREQIAKIKALIIKNAGKQESRKDEK